MTRNQADVLKDRLKPLRTLLTLAAIAAVAWIGKIAFEDMKVWAAAPVLTGKLLAIERGPMKQFLDYLPPAVTRYLPAQIRSGRSSGIHQTDLYRIEFYDPREERREVLLESAEFYFAPREIGEEVQVTYVAGDPPRVKGPARARDSAFIDYIPWVISVGALHLLTQLLLGLLPALLRLRPRLRLLVPNATFSDPDRPELR